MRVHESAPTEASQVGLQVGNACALRQLQMQIAMHVGLQTFFCFARCILVHIICTSLFEEKLYCLCGGLHHLPIERIKILHENTSFNCEFVMYEMQEAQLNS